MACKSGASDFDGKIGEAVEKRLAVIVREATLLSVSFWVAASAGELSASSDEFDPALSRASACSDSLLDNMCSAVEVVGGFGVEPWL